MYAEQAYFDGVPVQHCADWQERNRLKAINQRCHETARRGQTFHTFAEGRTS